MATGHAHNNDAHGHDGYDSEDETDDDEYGSDADRRPNIPADIRTQLILRLDAYCSTSDGRRAMSD